MFDRTKLLHIGGVSTLPQIWEYFSTDDVTAKGYIKSKDIKAGDFFTKVEITRGSDDSISAYTRENYYVTEDISGELTLINYKTKESSKYGVDVNAFLGDKSSDGMLRLPTQQANLDLSGIKSIGSQALMNKFLNMNITSVDFSDLESLDAASACEGAFYACSLTKVDFPKLSSIQGSKALKLAFGRNLHLSEINFNVLSNLGVRTDQFDDMLEGVTGCTVHFPAGLESTLSNWTSVQNGFGGTNTVILYDL